jgi:serine/threonine protein kinase
MADSITLDLLNFQASASSWRTLLPNALLDLFFFKAAFLWGQEEVEFLNSATDLEDATGWRPVRPLGKGAYGIVGLWQRFDHTDTVIDSIAIKQQKYLDDQRRQEAIQVGSNGLAKEAELMGQLNRDQNPNIILLRGFKNNTPERLWRFYFEFAPWGDLSILIHNYRAWNTYFPEEFLWHIFHGLANATLKMEGGPFGEDISSRSYGRGQAFIIHLDMKPANLFLGDAVDEHDFHFSNYPTVKVGDFGLAQLSSPNDARNPVDFRWCGTIGYRPPVRFLFELPRRFCANRGLGA